MSNINGILLERCLHLVQKYPKLTFVVVLLIASDSIMQQIKYNKLNNEIKNLKIQGKLLEEELKELQLAVANQEEDRKADLKEGLQRQDEVRDKEEEDWKADLKEGLQRQDEVRDKEVKDLQQECDEGSPAGSFFAR